MFRGTTGLIALINSGTLMCRGTIEFIEIIIDDSNV